MHWIITKKIKVVYIFLTAASSKMLTRPSHSPLPNRPNIVSLLPNSTTHWITQSLVSSMLYSVCTNQEQVPAEHILTTKNPNDYCVAALWKRHTLNNSAGAADHVQLCCYSVSASLCKWSMCLSPAGMYAYHGLAKKKEDMSHSGIYSCLFMALNRDQLREHRKFCSTVKSMHYIRIFKWSEKI